MRAQDSRAPRAGNPDIPARCTAARSRYGTRTLLAAVLLVLTCLKATSPAQTVPWSPRSARVVNRVTQDLNAALETQGLTMGSPVYLRIFKEDMQLEVWVQDGKQFRLFRTYPVCTWGSGSLGPKNREEDGQAPEGFYFVTPGQLNPWSRFHLAFNIGYPNAYDRAHGRTGGAIMVHGDCVSIGCYAMTDQGIDEIYTLIEAAFRKGQPFFRIHIFPFRMSDENMGEHLKSEWFPFWENLKEGHDFFEAHGNVPPNVEVRNGRYVFDALER